MSTKATICILLALSGSELFLHSVSAQEPAAPSPPPAFSPDVWRKEHRIIDLHMHIDAKKERFDRAVQIMDAAGIGIGVNLSGRPVTHAPGEKSEFERVKEMADRLYP